MADRGQPLVNDVRSALDLMALQPSLCLVLDQEVAIKYFSGTLPRIPIRNAPIYSRGTARDC